MKIEFKRILALILAMSMLMMIPVISMAEETNEGSEFEMMSLLPIDEVYAYIDLTEIPLEKLPKMTTSELFSYLRNEETDELIEIDATASSVWANFFNDEGEYLYDTWKIFNFDESINILDLYGEENYGVEVIIGSGNQLDPENVRYFVDFRLPYRYADMDLSGYIYDELYDFNVLKIAESIPELKIRDTESVEILWYVEEIVSAGYEFEYNVVNGWLKLDYDDTVKFAPDLEELNTCGSWDTYMKMIIKSDDTTAMYGVYVNYPDYNDVFECSIYTQDIYGKRSEVAIDDTYMYESEAEFNGEYIYYYDMYTNIKSYYSDDDEYYLGIKLTEDFNHCQLKAIKGWDHSEDKIRSWITDGTIPEDIDITKQIVADDMTLTDAGMKDYWLRNYGLELMLCIMTDKDIYIIPVAIDVQHTYDYVDVEGIFEDVDMRRNRVSDYWSSGYEDEKIGDEWHYTEIITYYLKKGYNVSDEYSIGMSFYDGDSHSYNSKKVDKAVVGHYYSLEEAKNKPDIKKQLFAEDMYEVGAGYKDDFSGDGVDFTIFSDDNIWHFRIVTAESDYDEDYEGGEDGEVGEAPEVGSSDSNFRVVNLYSGDDRLDTYTIPYEYDTYYCYGYQTLLINDTEVDMSAISPEVNLGDNVKVYHSDMIENTDNNYYNRLLPRDFTKAPVDATRDPYNSVRYTVSAQNHVNQKNYWVTAVKKEEGAKLFVNGPDEREIFLNNYFGNVHDIFVANVGSEELTGVNVTIDATNVKLDEYWTLGGNGNSTLAPFTTTSNGTGNYHGELFNVAKIRLIPDGEGDIEGTLTITANELDQERVITLSGKAGNPKIDTTVIHDAVKYVPYSSIITTNNMHDWNKVTFSICEGRLPEGLTLYPSGEIYGVPKETGEFPITIRAKYSYDEFETSYADIVLTVKDNSDANVNASVDDGYEITTRLPATISKYTDMDFVIDGEFAEFVDLWLDGEKLAKDVDYTAVEGSTKITIKSKTISDAGKGKHTISAEFRVGGDKNNKLKTASQNFTVGSASVSKGGGGRSSVKIYDVMFNTNGGSAVDKQTIKMGNMISVLPIPEREGYVFAGWYKDEILTQMFDASEKVTSKLNLYAKWDAIAPDKAPVEVTNFSDMSNSDWFYEDVEWACTNNVMVGYNDSQFAPLETVTNSMVVTVLARLANADITAYENMHIEGVEDGLWYTPYANWAKEVGIADDLSFATSEGITREMMSVVLMRFFEYMEKEFVVTEDFVEFADADLISDKAMNSIQNLYKLGILKGTGNKVINPLGNTTRAEFAALIHRVYTLLNE